MYFSGPLTTDGTCCYAISRASLMWTSAVLKSMMTESSSTLFHQTYLNQIQYISIGLNSLAVGGRYSGDKFNCQSFYCTLWVLWQGWLPSTILHPVFGKNSLMESSHRRQASVDVLSAMMYLQEPQRLLIPPRMVTPQLFVRIPRSALKDGDHRWCRFYQI